MKKAHIITVHGTWGAEEKGDKPKYVDPVRAALALSISYFKTKHKKAKEEITPSTSQEVGDKWWQPNSTFTARLIDCLRKKGIKAEIEPFEWASDNSDFQRFQAAGVLQRALLGTLQRYRNASTKVHVIAHSHGGNVVEQALNTARARPKFRKILRRVSSVSCVGTPYFRKKLPPLIAGSLIVFYVGGLLLTAALTASVVAFGLNVVGVEEIGDTIFSFWFGVIFLAASTLFLGLIAWFYGITSWGLLMRFIRTEREPNDRRLSIWHPNDEAIAALQVVEKEKIKGVSSDSVRQNIFIYILFIVFLLILPFAVLSSLSQFVFGEATLSNFGDRHPFFEKMFIFILIVDAAAFLVCLFGWLFFVSGIFKRPAEFIARRLNLRASKIIKGLAFGEDQITSLSDVSTQSHICRGKEVCLDGELGQKMADSARKKLVSYIEESHSHLLLVNPSPSGGGFLAEAAKDLKGGELIHTSYFDYEEIAEMIADHIAAHTE